MSARRLLVLVPDRPSEILAKGEYPPRYYNPGEVFDEVHLLLPNDDRPDLALLRKTAGRARLEVHRLPLPAALPTLGRWRPLLGPWLRRGVRLASAIAPDLVRCYGNTYHGTLAAELRRRLGVPLVVSLHINRDEDVRGRLPWRTRGRERLAAELTVPHERATLRAADWVLPVYEPIREYALRRGARRVRVCYNMLDGARLVRKESYALHAPPRVISVGRQFAEKNPEALLRAAAELGAEVTLVGDGPLHERLRAVAAACGARAVFHRAVPNDRLCAMLPEYDVFATHTDYWELGKAVLEPLLTGLPVVLNRRRGRPVPELAGDWVLFVENTPAGYRDALARLFGDEAGRAALGRRGYAVARERFGPESNEEAYAALYRDILAGRA